MSLRRILASRANGVLSRGPASPEGKRRCALNAIRHGLLSDCVVLPGESGEAFAELLAQHIDRFDPADGVEFGMIEEMAAAYWRLRRSWAIENTLLADALAAQPPGDDVSRITAAFKQQATSAELALLHRYETRLHLMYQRALHNILLLRVAGIPNEPRVSKLASEKGGEDPATVCVFPEKEPENGQESFADEQSSKHFQPDSTVVPEMGIRADGETT